jgi:hypothetical protein
LLFFQDSNPSFLPKSALNGRDCRLISIKPVRIFFSAGKDNLPFPAVHAA